MKTEILGVIPARGGSKGIPRKNLKLLSGLPLIAYTIKTAQKSRYLNDCIVSTDDLEIKEVSESFGCKVPFIRPSHLATDKALAVPTIQHAVLEFEELTETLFDIVIMLQPTAPLRLAEDIDNCVETLLKSDADSIISIVDVGNNHPMKMKKIENGLLRNYEEPPMENPPRQILPDVYIVNGAIYATRRDVLINQNTFAGKKCLPYQMPLERSVNIDLLADFVLAEYYLENCES